MITFSTKFTRIFVVFVCFFFLMNFYLLKLKSIEPYYIYIFFFLLQITIYIFIIYFLQILFLYYNIFNSNMRWINNTYYTTKTVRNRYSRIIIWKITLLFPFVSIIFYIYVLMYTNIM